ncbi:MAG: hypothetical protein QOJ42_1614, partial [Acidobacteriaceae bacterium]|nr:hypothetical protein [Acidobacteriaceae bacterium]
MKRFTYLTRLLILGLGGIGVPLSWAQVVVKDAQPATVRDQSAIAIGPGDLLDLSVF